MATDYDTPRARAEDDELAEESLEQIKARRAETQSGAVDVDEEVLAEGFELPGADLSALSGEELSVPVIPRQSDEFTCTRCFLVHHRSRRAPGQDPVCRDCI